MKLYRFIIDILLFSLPILISFIFNLKGLIIIMFTYSVIHFKYPWLVMLTKKLDLISSKFNIILWY